MTASYHYRSHRRTSRSISISIATLLCTILTACASFPELGAQSPTASSSQRTATSGSETSPPVAATDDTTTDVDPTSDETVVPISETVPSPETTPTPDQSASEVIGQCTTSQTSATQAEETMPRESEDTRVEYDRNTNTIVIERGAVASLKALSQLVDSNDIVREIAAGEWLLSANLEIGEGGELVIAAPEVRWLKLQSDDDGFVSIKARGGVLRFDGVCVTSWDGKNNQVDENYADGRSFVLARDGAEMTIRNSELSYLGYEANESYGVAYRLENTGGEVVDSVLGYNFYGLYLYEVTGLLIRGNEVHYSIRYGIDPHTRSDKLTIENNRSHHNGKQGIILAEDCDESIIRNNEVYSNDMHGIVLYQRSENNTVEGNRSYNNGYEGININDSSNNIIQNNTVFGNKKSGIGVSQSSDKNTVINNTVYENQIDGIAVYSESTKNELRANEVRDNTRYGIYIKSEGNTISSGHVVYGNQVGILLNVNSAPEVSTEDNDIRNNTQGNIEVRSP